MKKTKCMIGVNPYGYIWIDIDDGNAYSKTTPRAMIPADLVERYNRNLLEKVEIQDQLQQYYKRAYK